MKLILAALLVVGSTLAHAKNNYVCLAKNGSEAKDAAYVFNSKTEELFQNSKAEILDVGYKNSEGIQIENLEVSKMRCPGCYDLKGELMGALSVSVSIRNTKATFKISEIGSDEVSLKGELVCTLR